MNKSGVIKVLRWVPAVVWAGFIFFMSSRPGSDLEPSGLFGAVIQTLNGLQVTFFGADLGLTTPFLHFCEYAVLAILLLVAIAPIAPPGVVAFAALLISSLYGATDELHQWFVPARACDPADWIVDTLGALCAVLVGYLILRHRNPNAPED